MPYASNTRVSVEKSRQDVERLVAKYQGRIMAVFMPDDAVVLVLAFGKRDPAKNTAERMVRLTVPLPTREKIANARRQDAIDARYAQAVRGRWRLLLLLLKAKLEAVANKVRTFDEEFLADVVTHSGRTVGDMTIPSLREAYAAEGMPTQALPPAAPTARQLTAGNGG